MTDKKKIDEKETVIKFSIEELKEGEVVRDADKKGFKTQHGEGHTYDPFKANDQGLTYTPPTDPPVERSGDDPQGAEISAGFAPDLETLPPDPLNKPERIKGNQFDVEETVRRYLQKNGETAHLAPQIEAHVIDNALYLQGEVANQQEIGLICDAVREIDGVTSIHSNLRVAP